MWNMPLFGLACSAKPLLTLLHGMALSAQPLVKMQPMPLRGFLHHLPEQYNQADQGPFLWLHPQKELCWQCWLLGIITPLPGLAVLANLCHEELGFISCC